MSASMLKLPTSVRIDEVPALWAGLQGSLRAEAAQLRSAAGALLLISAADLKQFDSSVLTLLISAARLCADEGVKMQLQHVPEKLQELARVYGVAELLWPELIAPGASAAQLA